MVCEFGKISEITLAFFSKKRPNLSTVMTSTFKPPSQPECGWPFSGYASQCFAGSEKDAVSVSFFIQFSVPNVPSLMLDFIQNDILKFKTSSSQTQSRRFRRKFSPL